MFIEKLHILLPIFAAIVVSIVSFFSDNDLFTHSVWIIVTIVLFFIIGLIVKHYLIKHVFQENNIEIDAGTDKNKDM